MVMEQFPICKLKWEIPITVYWAYGALQPSKKRRKIPFTLERLPMGQKMQVYKLGKLWRRSCVNSISFPKWEITHNILKTTLGRMKINSSKMIKKYIEKQKIIRREFSKFFLWKNQSPKPVKNINSFYILEYHVYFPISSFGVQ